MNRGRRWLPFIGERVRLSNEGGGVIRSGVVFDVLFGSTEGAFVIVQANGGFVSARIEGSEAVSSGRRFVAPESCNK